jgi:hypothetical protein
LRNSFKYASRKDYSATAADLKLVYTAPSESAALDAFTEFSEKWERKYPAIIRLWTNAWAEFVPFLQFDTEIRTIICTINAIESINARIRRAVNARGHFPTEAAALKCVYLAIMSLDPPDEANDAGPTAGKPPSTPSRSPRRTSIRCTQRIVKLGGDLLTARGCRLPGRGEHKVCSPALCPIPRPRNCLGVREEITTVPTLISEAQSSVGCSGAYADGTSIFQTVRGAVPGCGKGMGHDGCVLVHAVQQR